MKILFCKKNIISRKLLVLISFLTKASLKSLMDVKISQNVSDPRTFSTLWSFRVCIGRFFSKNHFFLNLRRALPLSFRYFIISQRLWILAPRSQETAPPGDKKLRPQNSSFVFRGHKDGLTLVNTDQSPTQVMGQYSEQSTLRIGDPSVQKPGSSHRGAAAAAAGGQRRRHQSGSAPGSSYNVHLI